MILGVSFVDKAKRIDGCIAFICNFVFVHFFKTLPCVKA